MPEILPEGRTQASALVAGHGLPGSPASLRPIAVRRPGVIEGPRNGTRKDNMAERIVSLLRQVEMEAAKRHPSSLSFSSSPLATTEGNTGTCTIQNVGCRFEVYGNPIP